MGYWCRICGRERSNESFSGKGRRLHLCKQCQSLPRAQRECLQVEDELYHYLEQSNLTSLNIKRLRALVGHEDPKLGCMAKLLLDIAQAHPRKRHRWQNMVRTNPALFRRSVGVLGAEWFECLYSEGQSMPDELWDAFRQSKDDGSESVSEDPTWYELDERPWDSVPPDDYEPEEPVEES